VARRLVVPPHREGGQAQYIEQPVPASPPRSLGSSLDWARERIATVCGFGSAHQMRTHFTRLNCVTPQAYQRTFRARAAG
jgi:transcriptional regulator GlxA family with amidase domain